MNDLSKAHEMLKGNSATVQVLEEEYDDYNDRSTGRPIRAEIILTGRVNAVLEFALDFDCDIDEYGRTVDASVWVVSLKSGELPDGFLADVQSLKHQDLDDYAYDIEGFIEQS